MAVIDVYFMERLDIKRILCQQLQVLAEDSKKCTGEELCNIANNMVNLCSFILSMKD